MQPALSAYNEESEPWRLDRLAKAHAYAKGVMSNDPTCPSLDELVHALHDHKGFILVTWRGKTDQSPEKCVCARLGVFRRDFGLCDAPG